MSAYQYGGLGIRSIANVNHALLAKWLWRLGDGSNALWKQLCIAKYNITNDGWDIPMVQYRASSIWKPIMSTFNDFISCIRYTAYGGNRVRLWTDVWCGPISFNFHFPLLYLLLVKSFLFCKTTTKPLFVGGVMPLLPKSYK